MHELLTVQKRYKRSIWRNKCTENNAAIQTAICLQGLRVLKKNPCDSLEWAFWNSGSNKFENVHCSVQIIRNDTGIFPEVFPASKSSLSIMASRWYQCGVFGVYCSCWVVFDALKCIWVSEENLKTPQHLITWKGCFDAFCLLRRRQLRPSSPMKPQADGSKQGLLNLEALHIRSYIRWYWKDFEVFYKRGARIYHIFDT